MKRTNHITLIAAYFFIHFISSNARAQIAPGDLVVTGFSSTQLFVLRPNGTMNAVAVSPTFPGTTHAILQDRGNTNSFFVGGIGYLGRVTFTSPTTATYASITTAIGVVAQMTEFGGLLVIGDSGIDQMIAVDPYTGGIIPITSGAQPWGANLNASCVDRSTGDIYAGADNAIWRIPSGTSTPVPFASGWTAGASFVTGLAIDPSNGDLVATLLTVNRFVRIDATGTLTNISPNGAMPGPNAVDVDANGDFVVAASFGMTYRVPSSGGSPILLGTPSGVGGAATGVVVVRESFRLIATPTGFGGAVLDIRDVPSAAIEGFTAASFDTSMPVGAGPILGFSPDAFTFSLLAAFPFPSAGNPVHWTWPVASPLFPAGPFVVAPGTLLPGTTLDLKVVAINGGLLIGHAPVVRLTIN